jgi:DNA polymerase-3 subunit epsilon
VFNEHLVFLDLETTGGSALDDRIIEIGLIEVDRGRYVGEWSTLVNPGRSVPFGIQNLTGITDAMLADAPRFADVAAMLVQRLAGKVLVAHNARFDYGFVKTELERTGLRYTAPVLCTVKLSRRLAPHHARHNLDALILRHAIFCLDRHRALGDARVLWELARIWQREHGDDAVNTCCAELLRRPPVPAGLPLDLFDTLPESRGVYVFYGADGSALYVGRSANIRARVMAHFSEDGSAHDAAIAAEVRRVDWVEARGELGASLHEASLRRTLAPGYNRKAADAHSHWTWYWRREAPEAPPELRPLAELDRLGCENVYGFFRSRASARQALRGLCRGHGLCLALMGLEARGAGSEPCAAYDARECRGACTGAESPMSHAIRAIPALAGLRMKRWPYAGPIGIRERTQDNDRAALHLVDQWRYLGTAKSEADLHELAERSEASDFDPEAYRILVRFLKSPGASCDILPLTRVRPVPEEIT